MKVAVSGWSIGFQKVQFTQLLRRDLGYSLSRAKAATDAVLENRRVELDVPEGESNNLLPRLNEIGVKADLER